jgi:predicted DNA-binding transcriptional regulator YafY
MSKENCAKIKLLKLWEILNRESDAAHPLSAKEIIEKLRTYGISCDGQTLCNDVKTLNRYGYEVLCNPEGDGGGYYINAHCFEISELRILIDAVQAAGFIPQKKTEELQCKLAGFAGTYKTRLLLRNVVGQNGSKHINEHIYYSVNELDEAIRTGKQVSFLYFDCSPDGEHIYRKNGERYTVNPLAVTYADDGYGLICYHDGETDTVNYRIDRMEWVKTEDTDIKGSACLRERHK